MIIRRDALHRRLLADLLGPLRYLGRCAGCGAQFLSRHDPVYTWTDRHARYCSALCAQKGAPR